MKNAIEVKKDKLRKLAVFFSKQNCWQCPATDECEIKFVLNEPVKDVRVRCQTQMINWLTS